MRKDLYLFPQNSSVFKELIMSQAVTKMTPMYLINHSNLLTLGHVMYKVIFKVMSNVIINMVACQGQGQ